MDGIKDSHFTDSELEELTDLYNAMLTMKDSCEMHKFLCDLCSINELHSFLHRWQIVRRIEQGKSYEEIIKEISPAEETDAGKSAEQARNQTEGHVERPDHQQRSVPRLFPESRIAMLILRVDTERRLTDSRKLPRKIKKRDSKG